MKGENRLIGWFKKKKETQKEIKKEDEDLSKLYKELKNYSPANIVSDRIKSIINKIQTNINGKQIYLLERKIYIIYFIFFILGGGIIFSLFMTPKIIITINVVLTGAIMIFIATMITILIKHLLSKEDRKTKRERDLAEANYYKTLTNKN